MAGSSRAPDGTFAPGTKVQVGSHRVVIEKYLSKGGFAHVYLVRLPKPINGEDMAALKRVAVPDKEALTSMRTEVETMKKLRGHPYIVGYIDSHASQLQGGGFEVFLLMEYCSGGGLFDFMNTRLLNRLTEPEIVRIFSDIALGVAGMHYLRPPLLHRDLKVENVLISRTGGSRRFKLCDFGSAAPPCAAAANAAEGRLLEEEVDKNTTLLYRSPEMVDVYRKQPIGEKSDIWALGVLLYMLCYYTTPFEKRGRMAVLNASFAFPPSPVFSDRIKALIAAMLQEKPSARPNIYQVLAAVYQIRGIEVPIPDIYSNRTSSEARRSESLPSVPSHQQSAPFVGAYQAPVEEDKLVIPDIVPMRRGRPVNAGSAHSTTKPSPSPLRGLTGDPFAALDAAPASAPLAVDDDAAARFPPLDQFSLLHDSGSKFAFEQKQADAPAPSGSSKARDISKRVTEALADDAFAMPRKDVPLHSKSAKSSYPLTSSSTQTTVATTSENKPAMVSTGTMTSLESTGRPMATTSFARPVHRFPAHDGRASSQPIVAESSKTPAAPVHERPLWSPPMSSSQPKTSSSTSSRPSSEGHRPSSQGFAQGLSRSKSTASRMRPASVDMDSSPSSDIDGAYAGAQALRGSRDREYSPDLLEFARTGNTDGGEITRIASNVEFLRAMEEEDPGKKKDKRTSSSAKGEKRRSMPSISLSSTKSILTGRFGEAFRRFETNAGDASHRHSPPLDRESILTPITGSEATDGRSDDGQVLEEVEDTPEVRRELERRRLSMEERRVADAAAAYKKHVSEPGGSDRSRGRDGTRAAMIQNKVQSLLDQSNKTSPTKSAQGYGRFTHASLMADEPGSDLAHAANVSAPQPSRFAVGAAPLSSPPGDVSANRRLEPAGAAGAVHWDRSLARPSAPPKPHALRTSRADGLGPQERTRDASHRRRETDTTAVADDDWEAHFSKRYPNISLEMVETEIDKGGNVPLATRDV